MADSPAPSTRLDDQLCFALYAASRALTTRYRPALDELGLTYPQYLVLMLLWERDGQTIGALGDRLALDSGTLSPLINRMVAAGLVTRVKRDDDRRAVSVQLTPAGRDLEVAGCLVSSTMIDALGLDAATFTELRGQLQHITDQATASVPQS